MKELISVEEAVEIMRREAGRIERTEVVPLEHAGGRMIAQDVAAPIDQPPFDRSAVDGYACRSGELCWASKTDPVYLKVIGEVDAGQQFDQPVPPGAAVRIMTGAPLPPECDCCVRQEDTDYGEEWAAIYCPYHKDENVCFRGEDFKRGTGMICRGTKLSYIEIGILASMGIKEVTVIRLPEIILFVTGDEICPPGSSLGPGKIYNSNGYLLAERLRELGVPVKKMEAVADDPLIMAGKLKEASRMADLIITTGGVSVGKKDILHESLQIAGADKLFWRIMLKPGTPTIFSVLNQTPVISLSGNPFGALANLELLVRPVLQKLTGDDSLMYQRTRGRLAASFLKASKGRRFIRGSYGSGQVYLPEGLHSSGVLGTMCGCNCMIDIAAGTEKLEKGDIVDVVLL